MKSGKLWVLLLACLLFGLGSCYPDNPATGDDDDSAGDDDSGDLICTHDGAFDYRSAWESDPRAADTARQRSKRQRRRPEADLPPPS